MNDFAEIKYNLIEIFYRTRIILILISRYIFTSKKRTQDKSYLEYDTFWNNLMESKEIFKTTYPFTLFDKPVNVRISPFDVRKEVIIKILAKVIKEYQIKNVVEIGSGAGLNLLLLAPRFPNVQFYGIEPTNGGVELSKSLLSDPPVEFLFKKHTDPIKNVTIIQGSALDLKSIELFKDLNIDLIFTSAVIEQLNNYHEQFFDDLQFIEFKYFLFYEEWLEANLYKDHYLNLVRWDYFRLSWNYLNKYSNFKIIDRFIPGLQPSWLKYGVVFGEMVKNNNYFEE
jgi:tRNA G46 methylase TrmB